MAGFVDPAFKQLNGREQNFLVWRISKLPEENYEAKLIKKEFWGRFFEEDSYIVFSSTPEKKPFGVGNRRLSSKMEINIHFWLGSKLSEDDCRRTIIKAIELDDVLEGAAVLYREIQGYESNRFLSYFKSGLVITQGEITSVLRQAHVDARPKLFELSERASTTILTECPSISWDHLNCGSVVVLETMNRVFLWVGSEASSADKFLALKFENQRKSCGDNKKLVWVMDGKEEQLPKEDLNEFEELLSVKCKAIAPLPHHDLVLLQSKSRKDTELYKVISDEESNTIIYVKDGPLQKTDLAAMDICLIHHHTNCVWIWVSRRVSEEERSRAINIGIAYLENKPKQYAELSKMTVSRVVEGWEPQQFKLLFRNWSDSFPANENGYFRKAVAQPVNAKFAAEKLEDSPILAAESHLFDSGTGKMKILRVNGTDLEPLKPEEFGVFHSSFSYLVHYSYTVGGRTEKILYYWLGRNAPLQEKENSIWASLKDIPDLNDAGVRIRIEENHETPHFHAIFQGKILVLTRSILVSSSKKWSLDDYPVILLKIKGGDMTNTLSTEVEPRASSLNSFNVFLVRTPKLSFVWCGRGSKGDERAMAKVVARKWTMANFSVVLEGCETEEFWNLLGGFKCYSSEEEQPETEISIPPRAFKCSWIDGELKAMEIVNFCQRDFASGDLILLDVWKAVFAWTGSEVPSNEIFESEKLVKAYLNSDPCGRNLSIPIIHVSQGREPAMFRGYFVFWDKSSTVHYNAEIAKELLKEKAIPLAVVEEPEAIPEAVVEAIHPETTEIDPEKTNFPIEALQRKPVEDIPKGIDPNRKEEYLSESDFQQVFKMTRESFNKLPMWKRKNLKISCGFF